jgi:hypothetical protein
MTLVFKISLESGNVYCIKRQLFQLYKKFIFSFVVVVEFFFLFFIFNVVMFFLFFPLNFILIYMFFF